MVSFCSVSEVSFHPAVIFLLIWVLQDTRIRVIEKERSGQRSRRLCVINPSPEGSQSLVFSAESSGELEDWLDALHQHLFDQSECVAAFKSTRARGGPKARRRMFLEKQSGS